MRNRVSWIAAATVVVAAGAAAQGPPPASDPATAPLSARVPVDPAITAGVLPNGLRYYIRANAHPAGRVELRFVVRAGSILEDDDQRGAAHFVEHMAFQGTAHFPGRQLLSFLGSLGVNLGPHLNAATGFNETTFKMQVPAGALDRCLLVLEDWARGIEFDPAAMGRERGVITEEWRGRLGAQQRFADKEVAVLLAGSRYPDRSPIGTEASLQSITASAITRFYRDWYRPDLMAIFAVGDFDAHAVETSIVSRFSPLKGPDAPRPRPDATLAHHGGTTYSIASDPEAPVETVTVHHFLPRQEAVTLAGKRQALLRALAGNIMVRRLSDVARAADPPFATASLRYDLVLTNTRDDLTLSAVTRDDNVSRTLDALLTETRRAAELGFTQAELDEQRTVLDRTLDRRYAEAPLRESAVYVDGYVRSFITGDPVASDAYDDAVRRRLVPAITLADLNALAKEWFAEDDRFVVLRVPEKPGVALPDVHALESVARAVDARTLVAHADAARPTALMADLPTPGRIVETSNAEPPGVTVWRLSNGARVVLKPTTLKTDEVVFTAFSPGGLSLAGDDRVAAARAAGLAAASGGLGTLSSADVTRVLAGRVATAQPAMGQFDTRLSGSGTRSDLETLFQVIHLRFGEPREDRTAFESGKALTRTALQGLQSTPDGLFAEAVTGALMRNNPRVMPPKAAEIDRWNLDEARAFYRERFANAGNFTFVFVGSFDVDAMRPLVERYLASLPGGTHETWRDDGVRTADGVVERTIRAGVEPKARVAIVFNGPVAADDAHRAALAELGVVLRSRLTASMRNSLGATYSVSTNVTIRRIPAPIYTIAIQWDCDPQRVDELVARVFAEIETIKNLRLTVPALGSLHDAMHRSFDAAPNAAILARIVDGYLTADDPADAWRFEDAAEQIDPMAITDAARGYLDARRYVKVIMLPVETNAAR